MTIAGSDSRSVNSFLLWLICSLMSADCGHASVTTLVMPYVRNIGASGLDYLHWIVLR